MEENDQKKKQMAEEEEEQMEENDHQKKKMAEEEVEMEENDQKKKKMAEEEEEEEMEDGNPEDSTTMACPSFRDFSPTEQIDPPPYSAASDGGSPEFEFSTYDTAGGPLWYPVFGKPPASETESESESEGGLDGVPPESYCVWTPATAAGKRMEKSRSIGSGFSRRWSFRDLVVGRSRSDGKEKFVFLSPARRPAPAVAATVGRKTEAAEVKKGKTAEGEKGGFPRSGMEVCGKEGDRRKNAGGEGGGFPRSGMEVYGKEGDRRKTAGGEGGGFPRSGMVVYGKEGDRRRTTTLPYRKDLVGFFPAGRNLRPFF